MNISEFGLTVLLYLLLTWASIAAAMVFLRTYDFAWFLLSFSILGFYCQQVYNLLLEIGIISSSTPFFATNWSLIVIQTLPFITLTTSVVIFYSRTKNY